MPTTTTTFKPTGSSVVSNSGWTNVGLAYEAGDGAFAYATPAKSATVASKFTYDFSSIPADATITNMDIQYRWYVQTSTASSCSISANAFIGTTNVGANTETTQYVVPRISYMIPDTLPTLAQLSTFTVNIGCTRSSGNTATTYQLDYAFVNVTYSQPAGDVTLNVTSASAATASAKPPVIKAAIPGEVLVSIFYDFEDGLLPGGSTADPDYPYYVGIDPTGLVFSGAKVLRNGNDTLDNSTSYIEIPITFNGVGTITFDYFIESENKYDWAGVQLDGLTILKASGFDTIELGSAKTISTNLYPGNTVLMSEVCTYVIDPVSAGSHVLRFDYTKDSSNTTGFDSFLIKNLEFAWTEIQQTTGTTITAACASATAQSYVPVSITRVIDKTITGAYATATAQSYTPATMTIQKDRTVSIGFTASATAGAFTPSSMTVVKDRIINTSCATATANAYIPALIDMTPPVVTNPLTVTVSATAGATAGSYTPSSMTANKDRTITGAIATATAGAFTPSSIIAPKERLINASYSTATAGAYTPSSITTTKDRTISASYATTIAQAYVPGIDVQTAATGLTVTASYATATTQAYTTASIVTARNKVITGAYATATAQAYKPASITNSKDRVISAAYGTATAQAYNPANITISKDKTITAQASSATAQAYKPTDVFNHYNVIIFTPEVNPATAVANAVAYAPILFTNVTVIILKTIDLVCTNTFTLDMVSSNTISLDLSVSKDYSLDMTANKDFVTDNIITKDISLDMTATKEVVAWL